MYPINISMQDKHIAQVASGKTLSLATYRIDIIDANGEVIGCTDFISDALFAVRWHRMNNIMAYIHVHYDAKEISHPRY
jgi:hypothetical protein